MSLKTVTNVVHDRPHVRDETRASGTSRDRELDYALLWRVGGCAADEATCVTLAVPRIDDHALERLRTRHDRRGR